MKGSIPLLYLREEFSFKLGIVLDKPFVPIARHLTMGLAHDTFVVRHTLANLDALRSRIQAEILLGQQIACAEDRDGNNVALQLFGQMKSATTELMYLAIFRACAFGEDEYRIATFHTLADMCQHLIHRHRGGEEIGEPYHMSIDLAIPHPLSRHHNKSIGEHQCCQ